MHVEEFNDDYLSPLLSKLPFENKKIIVIGDFNMNVLNCENISSHAEFLDIYD